ncbi:inhibitor of apoptosis protein [Plakobranchus ocellatus]|uniref:Inhibitor of apoptosis protein n=1 Tax=Plakobranchus ocellatus TaxID=259542 RepID=A0AAV4DGZ5_9GAST|nr:inhibitor of apoptosis protein [Plakobranchus ocellatus]
MATGTSPEWYEESWRRDSFSNYPSNAVKSPFSLAAAGFIYIGNGCNDIVSCYFCKKLKSGWTEDEDIEAVHRRMSPDCPMVTGSACGNIPSNNYPEPGDSGLPEHSRIRNRHTVLSRGEFANTSRSEGMPTTNRTEPQTRSGRNMASGHSQGNSDSGIHRPRLSGSADSANSANPPRALQRQTYRGLGINMRLPLKNEYADRTRRLETFGAWPADHPMPAEHLADAGLVYAGKLPYGFYMCFLNYNKSLGGLVVQSLRDIRSLRIK